VWVIRGVVVRGFFIVSGHYPLVFRRAASLCRGFRFSFSFGGVVVFRFRFGVALLFLVFPVEVVVFGLILEVGCGFGG
jgi:hypothetical protein